MSKIAVAAAAASVPFSSTVIGDGGLVQRPVDQDPLFFRDAAEERLVGTEGKPRAQTSSRSMSLRSVSKPKRGIGQLDLRFEQVPAYLVQDSCPQAPLGLPEAALVGQDDQRICGFSLVRQPHGPVIGAFRAREAEGLTHHRHEQYQHARPKVVRPAAPPCRAPVCMLQKAPAPRTTPTLRRRIDSVSLGLARQRVELVARVRPCLNVWLVKQAGCDRTQEAGYESRRSVMPLQDAIAGCY